MLSNDCVVVPGFGAFIAQYTSSNNCAQNSTFTSPKRSISFNASINHNDGLLANSIAKKALIPYAEALKQIEKSTTICRQALSDGSEVPFGRLGFFISNAEGHIEFIPFHHELANDDFFGLQSFSFPTLAERNAQVATEETVSETYSEPEINIGRRNWFSHKAVQIAASIVMLVCLTFALSTPIIVDKPTHQLATLNVPTPTMPKHKVVKTEEISLQKQVEAASEKKEANSNGRYAIIICSLKKQSQVAQYFQENKDINPANVIKKNGYYMIYFNRGDNYQELVKEAKQMPKPYTEFWITQV
ncbi:MAG: hypothetical protein MR647_04735 [Bacteroidales bacterium]|nr:hypothetical protein [Muribaculaceae bacterium]MCI6293073.1 hypothetical protein [Bacteroidales bacterium]MCI6985317.1 hypothetical protein [Bacteroidales bacterium]MCI7032101.1 hypothetical protein [Bacteroidales bacterium]MCI7490189.1 hypothetical protein [Bacteroidales bacterium]